jgi:hypothetical protein
LTGTVITSPDPVMIRRSRTLAASTPRNVAERSRPLEVNPWAPPPASSVDVLPEILSPVPATVTTQQIVFGPGPRSMVPSTPV